MDRRGRSFRLLHRLCVAGLPLLGGLSHVAIVGAAPPQETLPAAVMPAQPAEVRQIPIGLDTVMRLADEQNLQLARGRLRVEEACAQSALAAKKWFPDLWFGPSYYRHEGGIQDEDGTFLKSSSGAALGGLDLHATVDPHEYVYQKVLAERNAWQQRGELSKLNYETLLDATSTYVDLVAARHAEKIAREMHKELTDLLGNAEKLAKAEKGAEIEAVRVRSELLGRAQLIQKLQAQADAASAKLVYLLGLDPCVELVPVDPLLVPIALVDAQPDTCELVAQALSQGPGIRELEGMLALVEDAMRRAQGPGKYLPCVDMRILEGAFGAGPGDQMDWANRMDAVVQVRWNLSGLATARERQQIANAQRAQVHMAYQDLRAKLTAGVQEARSAILFGSEELKLAGQQVTHASEARRLARPRLDKNIGGSSYTEVLLSMQAYGLAQVNQISSIRDYDKAQLRLLFLMGGNQVGALPATPLPEGEMIPAPKASEPAKP